MVYILGNKFVLDGFKHCEHSISFSIRASEDEINETLSEILGLKYRVSDEKVLNSSGYSFGDIDARYIMNGNLHVELKSEKSELIDKVRFSMKAL